jgi:hypothetical protein
VEKAKRHKIGERTLMMSLLRVGEEAERETLRSY